MSNLESLPSLKELQVGAQPTRLICGVYFLFDQGETVYIGKAINVQERIGQHFRDKQFDAYAYIEAEPARLLTVERAYLARYPTKYNKQIYPPRIRHEMAGSIGLKSLLAEMGIGVEEWRSAVLQTEGHVKGKRLSLTAAVQLLNWNVWPSLTPREEIKRQTVNFLRARGVPENRLEGSWSPAVRTKGTSIPVSDGTALLRQHKDIKFEVSTSAEPRKDADGSR